ncbi:hypothetical protein Ciccas_004921 [Cichlidogyrus casuarinus]|uniref:Uncharacterized protein n=1 Tax=Cichlidogyrus casuarinus TaxID=1844966 RepID=A0ABD2QA48_9PLAT
MVHTFNCLTFSDPLSGAASIPSTVDQLFPNFADPTREMKLEDFELIDVEKIIEEVCQTEIKSDQ